MTDPIRAPKRMTLTIEDECPRHVRVGDFIESTRSKYLVIKSRKVKTRDGAQRFSLGVVNVDDIPEGAHTWKMRWHSRSKRRPGSRRRG